MDSAIELTEDQRKLVEKVGVMHEKSGLQPAPSRVLSLLLISHDPELSFDEIRETLGLSKSAASNAINFLLQTGKLDYLTKPGERKRYFRNKVVFWKDNIRETFQKLNRSAEILEEVLEQRPGHTTRFNNSLAEVIDFIQFLNARLPSLYNEWEKQKG